MRKLLLECMLDVEPFCWGGEKGIDFQRRKSIRSLIKKDIKDFCPEYIEQMHANYSDIDVILNCYLTKPLEKDIDNLAKIPIDAIFFAAKDEDGKDEPGAIKGWESKISSLVINKYQSDKNHLEVIIHGMQS